MLYNPDFVSFKPILSPEDKQVLHTLSAAYPLVTFRGDARNYEEMSVDFVYTSAKIEGNTYDRIDTDNLLRLGITAGNKRYSDAVMLVNLRDAFAQVMCIEPNVKFDVDYICDLHKILMVNLLLPHQQGLVRVDGVTIGASVYEPMVDAARLKTEVKFILNEADKYDDPFEKSIYLHCNLAYLQFFKDGNKRSARMMQTAALVQGGVLPLFFNDTSVAEYKRATVNYYESGKYDSYVSLFKGNYGLAVRKLLGRDPLSAANIGDVVRSGMHSGSVVSVVDGVVEQKTGRGTVKHAVAALSEPVVKGDMVDINYRADGIGVVSGRGKVAEVER